MRILTLLSLVAVLGGVGIAQAQAPRPEANPNAPQNAAIKPPHDMQPGGLKAGHNSFTREQAREHIEKAGYSHVTRLVKSKDGLWQGRAVQDGKAVHVAMDFKGDVTSR